MQTAYVTDFAQRLPDRPRPKLCECTTECTLQSSLNCVLQSSFRILFRPKANQQSTTAHQAPICY